MKESWARWNEASGNLASGEGFVGALKSSVEGGLRQMSVPVGVERLKAGMVMVLVA